MYITRVQIDNIRSIKHLVWEIDAANAPGWHVILGDNGSGKSSLVKSIALTLVGEKDAQVLRQDWDTWIGHNQSFGNVDLNIIIDEFFDFVSEKETLRQTAELPPFFVDGYDRFWMTIGALIQQGYINPDGILKKTGAFVIGSLNASHNRLINEQMFQGFSSSFGPFRRFTGGDPEEQRLFEANYRYTRHLSAFSERTALTEPLRWFQLLVLQSYEGNPNSTATLVNIKSFINHGNLLPQGTQLIEVTSSGVKFRDGNGSEILVEEMSDGYRSVLSLTFELLRQLSIAYGPDIFETHEGGKVTVKVPGVVQIDEVDAHLHPTWQKRIGFWFREHFPQMQFIVTTHSPLVCQAAEKGSIFLLPRPGTEETGRMLEGAERDRLIYGDIMDAYSTEAFGGGETRSPKGQEMLDRLGELNVKEMLHGLTKDELQEQERLRAAMPTAATSEAK